MSSVPPFMRFDPVPVRAQRGGWSAARQRRFILALARGAGPGEAAGALGKTRQSAYDLRKRPGAESFSAAWDGAVAFAGTVRAAATAPSAGLAGSETLLVPRYYRGRLIGFVQREDAGAAMRLLRRLDQVAERLEEADRREWAEQDAAFAKLTGIDSFDGSGL